MGLEPSQMLATVSTAVEGARPRERHRLARQRPAHSRRRWAESVLRRARDLRLSAARAAATKLGDPKLKHSSFPEDAVVVQ